MKKQISLFLSLMLAVSCASESKEVGQEIRALDEAIADKVVYRQDYEAKMKILKRRLREACSDGERWTLIRQCYLEYKTYDIDSAAHYVKEMEALARRTGDKDLLLQAAVARVTVNHAQYLYNEGRLLFESLDTAGTSRASQAGYLSLGIRLYRDHLKYLNGGGTSQNHYRHRLEELRDAYAVFFDEYRDARFKMALSCIDRKQLDRAEEILTALLDEDLTMEERAVASYYMSKVFRDRSDARNRKIWLARAARLDVMIPIRESFSLWELALQLFDENNYATASRYMEQTLNEALSCNFRILYLKAVEAQEIIIRATDRKHTWLMRTLGGGLLILTLLITALLLQLLLLRRQHRSIQSANTTISSINADLTRINNELKDANKIKDNFLSSYMQRSTYYIRKVDDMRSNMRKLAKTEGMEGLMAYLRGPRFSDEEYRQFNKFFDKTFTSLFPHFLEKVNALLPPEDHFQLKSDGSFPTELRILAVIRLGITDNREIAEVLNCALRTVYKYRISLRGKALCGKENFDREIRKIDL